VHDWDAEGVPQAERGALVSTRIRVGGGALIVVSTIVAAIIAAGGGGGFTCTASATTAQFAAQFAALNSGTLCLTTPATTATYTFTGEGAAYTKSSPGVTIRSAEGVTARFESLVMGNGNDTSWVTFQDVEFDGGIICPPAHHITIRDSHNRSNLTIAADYGWNNPATPEPVGTNNACTSASSQMDGDSAIVLNNVLHDFAAHPSMEGYSGNEGRLAINYGSTVNDTHITVYRNEFTGSCGDGIQLGGNDDAGRGLVVLESTFNIGGCTDIEPWASDVRCVPVYQNDCPAPHSDDAQYVGGCCGTWSRNLFRGDVGLVRYDGGLVDGPMTVSDNAFYGLNPGLCVGSVSNAVFTHNVIIDSGAIICPTHQSSGQTNVAFNNSIVDDEPELSRGPAEEWPVNGGILPSWAAGNPHHNLCLTGGTCSGTGSINGQAPIFQGGADVSSFDSWSDFLLAAGSPGKGAGTSGKDIGVNP
jgi:hypothetical protein